MEYKKIYDSIVYNAKLQNRKKKTGIYYESHHIIPKCLGGTDDSNNKVLLTGREHFLVHKLLHKIYPNTPHLQAAFGAMLWGKEKRGTIKGSRAYEETRIANSESRKKYNPGAIAVKGRKYSKEHNDAISKRMKGFKHSDKTKLKMSNAKKGKPLSEEHKNSLRIAGIGRVFSEESKAKICKALTGKVLSLKTRTKIGKALIGNKNCLGRRHTEEEKQKMKDKRKLQIFTEETRKKLSTKTKERWKDEEYKNLMCLKMKEGWKKLKEIKNNISFNE